MFRLRMVFLKGVLVCVAFAVVTLTWRAIGSQRSLHDGESYRTRIHFRSSSPAAYMRSVKVAAGPEKDGASELRAAE